MKATVGHSGPVSRRDAAQVLGLVGAPLALLVGLSVKYLVVQVWGCATPHSSVSSSVSRSPTVALAVHVTAAVTLLLCLGATALAARTWRGAGREDPGDLDGTDGRVRTVASLGVSLGTLCVLVVLAQWLPQFVLPLCRQ